MSETTITSLAILKVNWDHNKDFIDNFIPFIQMCLLSAANEEVSLEQLQRCMKTSFGLKIPAGALKTILKRCAKRGLVSREQGIYRRNPGRLSKANFTRIREKVLRQCHALIREFQIFCKEKYRVEWSWSDSEDALLCYLQAHSVPIMKAAVMGEPISEPKSQGIRAEYLVAAFVHKCYKEEPELFGYLGNLAKGNMLANVLRCPDLGSIRQHFQNVEVYFDTRLLLRALGMAGPSMQAPVTELMDLVYERGGSLRCFEHTAQEMRGVLSATAHILKNPTRAKKAYGETVHYSMEEGLNSSDVERVKAGVQRLLRGLNVKIVTSPEHTRPLGLDEQRFQELLDEKVGYRWKRTRNVDIDSITSIYRLRHGQAPYQLERCDAVFVTTNQALAAASREFFISEGLADEETIPCSVLDRELATLVWLKNPGLAPDFPKKRLIAQSYAALNPSEELWAKYEEEICRLDQEGDITQDEVNLLRFSTQAKTVLMDVTLGEPEAFVEGSIEKIREKALAAVRADKEEELEEERQRRKQAELESSKHRQNVIRLCRTIGSITSKIVFGVLATLLLVAIYFTFPVSSDTTDTWLIVWAVLPLFSLVTLLNLIFGTTVRNISRKLEVWISKNLEKRLTQSILQRD